MMQLAHRLFATVLSLTLVTVASAQTAVTWDAAAGNIPTEDVPAWASILGVYLGTGGCNLASESLGPAALSVDTSGCPSDLGLYRGSSILGGFPTPPTHIIEGVLQVRSSLGASLFEGPAAISLIVPQNCAWTLHVDVGQILLHHGTQIVASTTAITDVTPRTYRLEVDPASRSARVYVDGVFRLFYNANALPTCPPVGFRSAAFGDLSLDEGGVVDWLSVTHDTSNGFATFCPAQPNSLGRTPHLSFAGSRSVAANMLELRAWDVPAGTFGYFLCSRDHAPAFSPPGSQGTLCLGGAVGRFSRPGEVLQIPPSGRAELLIDLWNMPQPNGAVAALPGDEWNFQFWYRDANPGPTSNMSGGLQVNLE